MISNRDVLYSPVNFGLFKESLFLIELGFFSEKEAVNNKKKNVLF